MQINYFTAAYPAQALLKLWIEDDKKAEATHPSGPAKLRQIVFINSAAGLCALPGYGAYSRKWRRWVERGVLMLF
jgi:3-dehydrosphinganine reductase